MESHSTPAMTTSERATVEVFADIGCPFTYVGLRRMTEARDNNESDVRFVVRSWPLEIVNGEPFDTDHLAAEIVGMQASVAPELFGGFNPDTFPNSFISVFGLAHVAYQKSVETGEAFSLAVRIELFEEGSDVSDPVVLGELADRFGLAVPSPEESESIARSDWNEGQSRGVIGSPHFMLPNGEGEFCPGLRISRRDDGSFDIEADHERSSSFMRSVLSLG